MAKAMSSDQRFEVAIVGGNFAGISAALYLVRARRRVVMFDDGLHRNRFAPASHGFLGQDGVAPGDIKAAGVAQLRAYPTFTLIEARVTGVQPGFTVAWGGGEARVARVILASGQRDILPDVPGLAECWGLTANACPYCHGYELADRPTGILLGSDPQAGGYLRQIARWAGVLTVFDNGAVLAAETLAVMAALGVADVPGVLERFEHEAGQVSAVWVAGRAVPLEAFYLHSRAEAAAPFAADLGCEMSAGPMGPHVTVDAWQRTTVVGVYAAGDVSRAMPAAIFAASTGAAAGLGCDMDLAGLM